MDRGDRSLSRKRRPNCFLNEAPIFSLTRRRLAPHFFCLHIRACNVDNIFANGAVRNKWTWVRLVGFYFVYTTIDLFPLKASSNSCLINTSKLSGEFGENLFDTEK